MIVETFVHAGHKVEIHTDDCPESPREWSTVGKILYTSDRYVLGDERVSAEEINEIMKRKDVVWLPVYAYIHGGVTISTGSFSCPWDSGMCGIIYAEREAILKEWNQSRLTNALREKVKKVLQGEIETYDQYLRGDVYGYNVKTSSTCTECGHVEEEILDSCWGYYGLEYCEQEARAAASAHVKEAS
jgi:hypothetical protein